MDITAADEPPSEAFNLAELPQTRLPGKEPKNLAFFNSVFKTLLQAIQVLLLSKWNPCESFHFRLAFVTRSSDWISSEKRDLLTTPSVERNIAHLFFSPLLAPCEAHFAFWQETQNFVASSDLNSRLGNPNLPPSATAAWNCWPYLSFLRSFPHLQQWTFKY